MNIHKQASTFCVDRYGKSDLVPFWYRFGKSDLLSTFVLQGNAQGFHSRILPQPPLIVVMSKLFGTKLLMYQFLYLYQLEDVTLKGFNSGWVVTITSTQVNYSHLSTMPLPHCTAVTGTFNQFICIVQTNKETLPQSI